MNQTRSGQVARMLQREKCPECGSMDVITDDETGEVTCSRCGLVIQEEALNREAEWRAFTPEERRAKARAGSPISLRKFDKGLSTTFKTYRDARGRSLSMKKRLQMKRLRKWQIRSRMHASTQRNLSKAMNELTLLSDKLHIPKAVAENAALIYRRALDKGLVRGRSIKGIAAASLYAACRLTRTPRSLSDVVEASTRSRKEVSRDYRLVQRELNLRMPIDDPGKYVSKIASESGLPSKAQNTAMSLIKEAKERNAVVGKGPLGVAAAALYIASIIDDEQITQRELAEAANVTEVTVRNRYKGLDEALSLGVRS